MRQLELRYLLKPEIERLRSGQLITSLQLIKLKKDSKPAIKSMEDRILIMFGCPLERSLEGFVLNIETESAEVRFTRQIKHKDDMTSAWKVHHGLDLKSYILRHPEYVYK